MAYRRFSAALVLGSSEERQRGQNPPRCGIDVDQTLDRDGIFRQRTGVAGYRIDNS